MAQHDANLSRIFHALGDPTRRALLQRLGQGALPVSVLAAPTGFALPTVLRHLEVLEQAGLIQTEKQGRTRLCRAVPVTLTVATDWLATVRAEWEARTDRLEEFLATLEDDDDPEPRD
ncbi:ArsR/SmtB family transcription factor [Pseudotabrizicola alkalilacus]|uniref:Transcriptional regulator n=1 Tax=Pseudotabrizicola alkalilacus TaxID=2305252 RepID=A0A411YXR8_9RHOB|nr:metalloregulator ArsR/SmtB family transcription factor [Pseudotabrizicola alkalilacus]RGP35687.1 transcriptional regulator [Pseudotabrizicola alkalilacus]